jgi:methyl-accepting chemotaxis protein
MLKNLKLLPKIWAILVIALLAFVIILAISISFTSKNSESIHQIQEKLYLQSKLASRLVVEFNAVEEFFTQAVSFSDQDLLDTAKEAATRVSEQLAELKRLDELNADKLSDMNTNFADYLNQASSIAQSIIDGSMNMSTAKTVVQNKKLAFEKNRDAFLSYEQSADQQFQHVLAEVADTADYSMSLMIGVGLILLLLMAFAGHVIGLAISKSANELANSLFILASGKGSLSSRLPVKGSDELSTVALHFNSFMRVLENSFTSMSSLVEPLTQHATDLSDGMKRLDSMAVIQREEAEMASQAMQEMQASVKDISLSASFASSSAVKASALAKEGLEKTQTSVKASKELNHNIESTELVIAELARQTTEVVGILKSINDIAEQTNLLALNAAIEAARAGEQGRGFAVVADEVRLLSSRTASSVKTIRDVLGKLTLNVDTAVVQMRDAVARASESAALTAEAGTSIHKISQEIEQINLLNAQIATATEEQTMVATQVIQNSVQMISALTSSLQEQQQVAKISHQLNGVASQLHSVAIQFRT